MPKETSRLQAFAIHLLLSAAIITAYMLIVLFIWYPMPFFILDAGWKVNIILITVDVIVGPLLTLIIFKPGKPGLAFDIMVIVILQIAALGWGVYNTYQGKPIYVTFAVDRFVLVHVNEIDNSKVPDNVRNITWGSPTFAYAEVDAENVSEALELFFKTGMDVEHMATQYRPYEAHLEEVFSKGLDIDKQIEKSEENKKLYQAFIEKHGGVYEDYTFFPIKGRLGFAVFALSNETGEVTDYILTDPEW